MLKPHPGQAWNGLQNKTLPSSIQRWPQRPPRRHLSFSSDSLDLDFFKLQVNTRKGCFSIHRKWNTVMSEETQVVCLSNLPNLISIPTLSCFRRARCHKCLISIIKVSYRQYRSMQQRRRWLFSYIWVAGCGTCGHMISELNHTRHKIKILCDIEQSRAKKKSTTKSLCCTVQLKKLIWFVLNYIILLITLYHWHYWHKWSILRHIPIVTQMLG